MAYTTLNSLLTAIADAIRAKKGTTAQINAQNFPSEIASISTGITIKTQTVTKTVSLSAYARQQVTFTFSNLKKVIGVSNITKAATSNAYGKYQDLGQRNVIPVSYISISGNTVTLDIWGQVDISNEANWSVTAIGE